MGHHDMFDIYSLYYYLYDIIINTILLIRVFRQHDIKNSVKNIFFSLTSNYDKCWLNVDSLLPNLMQPIRAMETPLQ